MPSARFVNAAGMALWRYLWYNKPMMYEFEGRKPQCGEGTFIAPSAQVIGDVSIGSNCYIGHGAIVRGDYGKVVIGDGTAVEEGVVIHAPPGQSCTIGSHVTLGHGAIVHGEELGDWVVVGMNAVTSIGSKVGEWSIVAEGAVVKQNGVIEAGKVAVGAPAKPVRDTLERDKQWWTPMKKVYEELADRYLRGGMKAL